MAGVRVGDKLWVREPFYLPKKFGMQAPLTVHQRGGKPFFVADMKPDSPVAEDWLGPRRSARTLLKIWHRQHLVVTGLERRRLHSITEPEAQAQGFACINHFARGWDKNLMFGGHEVKWAKNPMVIALGFDRVEGPVQ
jgi:hypothetical protein